MHHKHFNCVTCTSCFFQCIILCRFGKVLWRSDGRSCVSDEVLSGRYKVKDLEEGGKVSVVDVLGRRGIKWEFATL